LGITNGASGVGVWQKTLTADFTATPTRGAPPLTVQFTNTSAGDFTTSQWDFGDGATSTEVNPSHTYTVPGTYAVTLTVGDGAETSTITKPAYIVAKHFTYLPVVLRNYHPPNAYTYDNFNNAAFDGLYNQELWSFSTNNTFRAQQQSGALVLSNISGPSWSGGRLMMRIPERRNISEVQQFEGRLKMSSDRTGGWAVVQIYLETDLSGVRWYTQCYLGASNTSQPYVRCQICSDNGSVNDCEYGTSGQSANYNLWYKVRIEVDPQTAYLRFYLDDKLIGGHLPKDAVALMATGTFRPEVAAWNGDADTYATRYVDDVRITSAQ
jgi:hypothetical protein